MPKGFKPGVPLTVCALLGLIVLIGLGTWQARKIGPKTELLARIEAGLSAAPTPLPVHLDDPVSVEYHRFTFDGELLDREPAIVYGMNVEGKGGYHIYAPVRTTYGRIVIVNFGWIPQTESIDAVELPRGKQISISGVLLRNAVPGSFSVPNSIADRIFYTADIFDMAAMWGFSSKEYYHFRVFSDQIGAPDALPEGGQVRVDIPNNHLQYAITWYGLAITLLGVYIAFGFKRGRED